eukprot:gene25495-31963_t
MSLLSSNVLITCIAILTIDFPVFPRYFGKTEFFGTSLMDAGVGAFIISSAVTSKYARGISVDNVKKASPTANTASNVISSTATTTSLLSTCVSSLKRLPLQRLFVLLLGAGRLVALKAINYQEHVSEYGVHWNFFVTLYCVWTGADVLHKLIASRTLLIVVAVVSLLAYQTILLHTSLTEYVMHAPRVSWLSSNKEGVVSLLGYIPLYLVAEGLAFYVFFDQGRTRVEEESNGDLKTSDSVKTASRVPSLPSDEYVLVDKSDSSSQSKLSMNESIKHSILNENIILNASDHYAPWNVPLLQQLTLCCALLWTAWWFSSTLIQPTSRRLVNLAYVTLTLALSFTMTLMMYAADTLGERYCAQSVSMLTNIMSDETESAHRKSLSPVLTLEYFNKYSLVVFLGGNLMTGAVNSSVRTLYASTTTSLCILVVYGGMLAGLAYGCEWVSMRRGESKKRGSN